MEVETFSTQIPLFFSSRQDEFFVLRCEFLSEFFILVTFSDQKSESDSPNSEGCLSLSFVAYRVFLLIFKNSMQHSASAAMILRRKNRPWDHLKDVKGDQAQRVAREDTH